MKKIKFNAVYECSTCKQRFIGYRKNNCPLCGSPTSVSKTKHDKIVTFTKKGI